MESLESSPRAYPSSNRKCKCDTNIISFKSKYVVNVRKEKMRASNKMYITENRNLEILLHTCREL